MRCALWVPCALCAGECNEPRLVFFASRRIAKGREIIADYGPDYWELASEVIIAMHENDAGGVPHSQKDGGSSKATGKKKKNAKK